MAGAATNPALPRGHFRGLNRKLLRGTDPGCQMGAGERCAIALRRTARISSGRVHVCVRNIGENEVSIPQTHLLELGRFWSGWISNLMPQFCVAHGLGGPEIWLDSLEQFLRMWHLDTHTR